MRYDLAIVGAGIVGLAHALAAARRGLRVVVVDRDRSCVGASVRNFGLVVVTGQESGEARSRAERSRDVWLDIAGPAGIEIAHRGMLVVAQRPEAFAVLEAYKASEEGQECQILTPSEIGRHQPEVDLTKVTGGLYSPSELRVESRDAIPKLVSFLSEKHGVAFRWATMVNAVNPPLLETSRGTIEASRIVVCPGDDLDTLFGDRLAAFDISRCKLQMLRLSNPGFALRSAVITDLSLVRYGGFGQMPGADALRERLQDECALKLKKGIHLIVVQSKDGSLVIGDSHDYSQSPDPFSSEEVDRMILDEFRTVFGDREVDIESRWVGTYASAADRATLQDAPHEAVRLVVVTSGTGASTAFAIGEETITDLFGS